MPAILIFVGFALVPIVWSFVYSLYSGVPGLNFKPVGIENYLKLFSDKMFLDSVATNLIFILIVVTGQIASGLLFALIFFFYIKKYNSLIRTIIFFPVVLPTVAVAQLFVKIFEVAPQYGLLNSILDFLHLGIYTRAWHAETSTALFVICFAEIWRATGFYAVIFYSALASVPDEVLESAKLVGASNVTIIGYIILPLIRPLIITATVFSLSGTLKVFDLPYALTGGGPGNATQMVAMYMYKTAFIFSEYGYGSAIAIFLLLECLLITFLFTKMFSKNEDYN
jgi:raffinose/stachyose/melibiose transport system permease protein